MSYAAPAALLLTWAFIVQAAEEPFAPCVEAVENAPDAADSYYCFVQVAQATARHAEAARHLEGYVRERPEAGRLRLNLAIVASALGREDAGALYRRAVEDMIASGDDRGAVFGLSGLSAMRIAEGGYVEAEELLDQATALAVATGDAELIANTQYRRAQLALGLGDLGRARRELLAAHDLVEPDGPRYLRAWTLSGLGAVRWALGEHEAALRAYERELELVRGRVAEEPGPLHNIALVLSELRDRGRRTDAEVEAALRAAQAAAAAAGDAVVEAEVRLLLAADLHGEAALAELRELEEIGRARGNLDVELQARRFRAKNVAQEGDLPRALAALDAARRRAEEAASPFHVTRAQVMRAGLLYSFGNNWVGAYEEALDAVERIRGLQPEARTADAAASGWSYVYRRYAAKLLDRHAREGQADDLARAFRTIERLRGATARERLRRGTDTSARAQERRPVERRLREILGEIARLQRSAGSAASASTELARLEREETRLRDDWARLGPPREPAAPAGVDEVRAALGPGRALVTYLVRSVNVQHWPEVPSDWAIVVTSDDAWGYPLHGSGPERAARIEVYRGLLANRDGSEQTAAARLWRELLAGALQRLPETIDRLVVVPDGAIASLPLETLRPTADALPLGLTHAVAYAPSATVWLQLQEPARRPLPAAALSFADPTAAVAPDPPSAGASEVAAEAGVGERATGRDPLPWARVEGRGVIEALGGRLLEGAEASEGALAAEDLARYGLIHFGAHALVSEAAPRRSAIALAPGTAEQDGLLQLRDIVDLPLDGQIVVLAACRSADGKLVDGAGVVGLADAFLRARASAVIGTLWPVLDDETSRMTIELARQLAAGATVAEAARAARRRLDGEGRPAGSWGGIVVLGDDEARLAGAPGARAAMSPGSLRLAGLAAALALVAIAVAVHRARRRTRRRG